MIPGAYPEHESDTRSLKALGVPASFFEPRVPARAKERQLKLTLTTPYSRILHRRIPPKSAVALAEERGYHTGKRNGNYHQDLAWNCSSGEALAWLRGWRRGQQERFQREVTNEVVQAR